MPPVFPAKRMRHTLPAQDRYTEVAGELAADTLRVAHQNQNRGQGVTKAQYVEATMAFMEKENAGGQV